MSPLLALLLAASPGPPAQLLVPGRYPADALRAGDKDPFLALCGDRLVPVQVDVRQDAEGSVVQAPCDALALFRHVPNLRQGPVQPAVVRPVGAPSRGSPEGPLAVELRLGERRWRILRTRLGSTGYRLELRAPRQSAVLYECQSTDLARWELLWAGDLDRDGRVDLLLDASDAQDRSELRLFLSRGAEEAVDEVALLDRPVQPISAR